MLEWQTTIYTALEQTQLKKLKKLSTKSSEDQVQKNGVGEVAIFANSILYYICSFVTKL